MNKFIGRFYLDKEKDIIVNLYNSDEDELTYILETPNHNTGNLISNLAKICNVETIKNEQDKKIITGKMYPYINGDNNEVYIFRLGGIKIANIYPDGAIEIKASIPAIAKTLMSQTKDYNLPIEKTIVKSYIPKKLKFRTDLHTHMNANLSPDVLIALGIKHQIRYPLYYIKKLNLKMTQKQEAKIMKQRLEVSKQYKDSTLTGKYLARKIDDNTFINFADFILNNLENASYNLSKIRTSLAILKDGQAVFTNLEKVYLYRYVFAKGMESDEKIALDDEKINLIPELDIKNFVKQMLEDTKNEYKSNTLRQDKLLWIAREYQKQGIKYVEITNTDLAKTELPAVEFLEEVHSIMPKIEKETGTQIRFLVGIRRIPLTIIKDQKTSENYLQENINVLRAVSKSPYVVGSDFIGEEINDITELKPVINEIVKYVEEEDEGYTIRIHAGENDSLRDNVIKSVRCVKECVKNKNKMPNIRIGHGLYTANLLSEKGQELVKELKETNTVLEFQITSNVRLNNLNALERHPLKQYLQAGVRCVQGTDGCGIYGIDTIDEQLALYNLLGISNEEFEQMRKVEDEIIENRNKYFREKSRVFEKLLENKTLRELILELEEKYIKDTQNSIIKMRINNKVETEKELKQKIKSLPENKVPIIIAGGSFNSIGRNTKLTSAGKKVLENLVKKVNSEKAYFVIGHKMQGYEKALIDIAKDLNKDIEIDAIVPKEVNVEEKNNLLNDEIDGICVSTEAEEFGIYKSFNYEIFERRNSVVLAFDGNSPVSNLIQEAKNGKGKAKIYVNEDNLALQEKAKSLQGYVTPFNENQDIVSKILQDNPEIQ